MASAAALVLVVACSKAPPPAAPPDLDVDASKAASNADQLPIAPPTPPGQAPSKPLSPLPVGPPPATSH